MPAAGCITLCHDALSILACFIAFLFQLVWIISTLYSPYFESYTFEEGSGAYMERYSDLPVSGLAELIGSVLGL